MKFSVPFFKKRKTNEASDAQDDAGSQTGTAKLHAHAERVVPPSETSSEKKPFVVPESARAMPSFSQAAELANLAEINASIQSQSASAVPSPSPTASPTASTAEGRAGASAVTGTAPTKTAPVETAPASASASVPGTPRAPAVPAAAMSPLASELPVETHSASAKPLATAQSVISAAEAPKQMESLVMSAEDVIAAYKIFLKRHPENLQVIEPRVGHTSDRVLYDFITSGEFLARPEVPNLILALAKKIIDTQKASTEQRPSSSGAAETPTAQSGGST